MFNSENKKAENKKFKIKKDNFFLEKDLIIDYLDPKFIYRINKASYNTEIIAKAIGIKKYKNIFDLTAGLGIDSAILASLGCKVTMLEKNKIIYTKLKNALLDLKSKIKIYNKKQNIKTNSQFDLNKFYNIINNITLINNSSVDYLKKIFNNKLDNNLENPDTINFKSDIIYSDIIYPDVIYLDPMFPEREKSSLVKKNMRLLSKIVGKDTDSEKLLTLSLKIAKFRVVVKSPKYSNSINNIKPDLQYYTNSNRFDVYLCP